MHAWQKVPCALSPVISLVGRVPCAAGQIELPQDTTQEAVQKLASCLGATDPALAASAAAALGLVSLQAALPLPVGDLEAVQTRCGRRCILSAPLTAQIPVGAYMLWVSWTDPVHLCTPAWDSMLVPAEKVPVLQLVAACRPSSQHEAELPRQASQHGH